MFAAHTDCRCGILVPVLCRTRRGLDGGGICCGGMDG